MRNKLLLPILLSLPVIGFAQKGLSNEFNVENARNVTDVFNSGYDVVPYDLHDSAIQGSAMLRPTWMSGEILLVGNTKPVPASIKYDVYHQQLRVRRAQGDSVIVPVTKIKEFTLNGLNNKGEQQARRFVRYESSTLPAELNGVCAEVLNNGENLQLLKFWRKGVVRVAENSTNMAVSHTVRSFKDLDKYYLRWAADGRMVAVRPKRGSIKDALAEQTVALTAFEARKGNLNSEAELIAALDAINPLLATPAR